MTLPEAIISVAELRKFIGIELSYNHETHQIIEVLENGPALVLQQQNNSSIQNNQFGNANRRTPDTICIEVLSNDKNEFSSLFLSLNLI